MTIQTDKGVKISTSAKPEWNAYHQLFYVAGYRWIKTKQAFSSNCLLHSFKSYEEVGA